MNNRNRLNVFLALAIVAALLFSLLTAYAISAAGEALTRKVGVSAKAATLYVPETKQFLFEKSADVRLPMASTTKIMTGLIAAERLSPSEMINIDPRAIGIEGSSAYLKEGDRLSAEELIYALMLGSANDAAVAIACHVAGGVDEFAALMNERADALGLSDTHFTNPHGLDDENHYTTAHDLALIAAAALENATLKKVASTYKKSFITEERRRTYVNHNKLLKRYDGAIGLKTGFTKKSGRCLVGAAQRDGITLVSVTLDAPDDWYDHENLFEYGFSLIEKLTLARCGEISYELPVIGGDAQTLRVSNPVGASLIASAGEHEVRRYIRLTRYVSAPVKAGDVLGAAVFVVDGKEAARIPLVAECDINIKKEKGLFSRLFG